MKLRLGTVSVWAVCKAVSDGAHAYHGNLTGWHNYDVGKAIPLDIASHPDFNHIWVTNRLYG
jgi:hypothetical protein